MYFYILCTLLVLKAVEPFSACDRNRQNNAINTFHSLSNDIINLDQRVQDTCKQFPNYVAWETMGKNSYRLEVSLPYFDFATFVVKISHRLMYINGHYPQVGYLCDLTYVDIRVLPNIVDAKRGIWTYWNGKLIVAFPYAQRLQLHESNCSTPYIDPSIVYSITYLWRADPTDTLFYD